MPTRPDPPDDEPAGVLPELPPMIVDEAAPGPWLNDADPEPDIPELPAADPGEAFDPHAFDDGAPESDGSALRMLPSNQPPSLDDDPPAMVLPWRTTVFLDDAGREVPAVLSTATSASRWVRPGATVSTEMVSLRLGPLPLIARLLVEPGEPERLIIGRDLLSDRILVSAGEVEPE